MYNYSYASQSVELRLLPAPNDQETQMRAPAPLEEKTLHELNEMGPYDCSVRPSTFYPFIAVFVYR